MLPDHRVENVSAVSKAVEVQDDGAARRVVLDPEHLGTALHAAHVDRRDVVAQLSESPVIVGAKASSPSARGRSP